jgi:hypothetical protein
MRNLPCFVLALTGLSLPVLAQANCSAGAGPATSIATLRPFAGTSLYGHPNYPNAPGATYTGFSFLFDLTLLVPCNLSQIDISLYDAGGLVDLGNGTTVTSPNQVGATANVDFFIIPATRWAGFEEIPSAWILLQSGTLTVGGHWGVHSPIVFNPPINLPEGLWAVALKIDMTTNGPNPGPLHPMLDPNVNGVPTNYADPVITWENIRFQRETWGIGAVVPAIHKQNLEIFYTPLAAYANWTSFGTGCVAPNVPVLGLDRRPVVGNTITFQTSGILPTTVLSATLMGFSPDPTGLDLTGFGLPGCSLYLQLASQITTSFSVVANGLATTSIFIPNDPMFSGIVLYAQAAPITPGFNAGFFASNAICVALGRH